MTTFTAVVTCHANERGLRHMLGQLRYQTLPADETLVYCSEIGIAELARLREDFPEATFQVAPDRRDWGHEKRAAGLAAARGEWVGFFNDDDSYDRCYLERMLEMAVGEADVVWCWWNGRPEGCRFALGDSTSGNFVVRTEVARRAGYDDRVYEADGTFIDRVAALSRLGVEVRDVLYRHNEQR